MIYRIMILLVLSLSCLVSCSEEELFSEQIRQNLWLFHEGAEMPVVVEGNTASRIFFVMLHGGPGGSAQPFNSSNTPFTDRLEEEYAVVYWDQRNAGLSRGEWDESKITIAQHVEDLEKMIDLLHFKYGEDIQLFLSGSSWGGYLGQAYLMKDDNQSNIKAWINIGGLCHRDLALRHAQIWIAELAVEFIDEGKDVGEWIEILQEAEDLSSNQPDQYDVTTENPTFDLMRKVERLTENGSYMDFSFGSTFQATYSNNAHPIILGQNDRTLDIMVPQLFEYDAFVESNLEKITIPSLFLYGYLDVRTSHLQGEYAMNLISTETQDKELVLFFMSGHSSFGHEANLYAEHVRDWIELYRD